MVDHPVAPLPARQTAIVLGRHLLAVVPFAVTLGFLLTAPHTTWLALLWLAPGPLSALADRRARRDRRQPPAGLPRWPFDALLYALAAAHVVAIGLLVRLFASTSLWSLDGLVAFLVVGGSSASAIVVAHELIHRPSAAARRIGRALLCTVLYDHFFTEHLRGHHVRVGTADDPATARFGESFWHFYRRTVPGQLRSAWRLEASRLGDPDMRLGDRRVLRNRVLHGLACEGGLALGVLALLGIAPFFAFVLQAWHATLALEEVNYFEHWGLTRRGRKVRTTDSWDTDSGFTLGAFVGLARHADHHTYASRPFQELRHVAESPKLPTGYLGMDMLVIFQNARFRRLMTDELRRRRLGPFAGGLGAPSAA